MSSGGVNLSASHVLRMDSPKRNHTKTRTGSKTTKPQPSNEGHALGGLSMALIVRYLLANPFGGVALTSVDNRLFYMGGLNFTSTLTSGDEVQVGTAPT